MKDELKKYREENGLSQLAMAEILGVHQTLVSGVELGHRAIPKSMALELFKLDAERFPLEKTLAVRAVA